MTWANIAEFPGYQASSDGEVRSLLGREPRVLRPSLNRRTGYLQVCVRREHKTYVRTVHLLVALAFIGPQPWGMKVAHYDDDKLNNRLWNLNYETRSQIARDYWRARRVSGRVASPAIE
jgi:hypothetical protein